MDRNRAYNSFGKSYRGQARKSLWIETPFKHANSKVCKVRLVRACGSKPLHQVLTKSLSLVRLVRACGSKLSSKEGDMAFEVGQARKSLWIETVGTLISFFFAQGQARKSLWIETDVLVGVIGVLPVRLVRACGSKP